MFDAHTCGNALKTLLHALPDVQQDHAAGFLLAEVERLYVA